MSNTDITPLQICEHPLSFERQDLEMPYGMSVSDMLVEAGYEWILDYPGNAIVTLESADRVRTVDARSMVVPVPGETLAVRVIPGDSGGDGNKGLRTMLTVVVLVAAAVITYNPGLIGVAAQYGVAAGAAVSIVGSIAVNAIAPVQPYGDLAGVENQRQTSAMYAITGAKNQANKYGPIPTMAGGSVRIWPPYAAVPYTEVVGEDQYLRQRFALVGPVDLSDFKIGETDIDDYEDVEIEYVQGFPGDEIPTLYADGQDIHEESVSAALTYGGDQLVYDFVTEESSDQIDFTLDFDEFFRDGSDPTSVTFKVQYRLDYTYQRYSAGLTPIGNPVPVTGEWYDADESWSNDDGEVTISGYSATPTSHSYSLSNIVSVPADSLFLVYEFAALTLRVRRYDEDNEQNANLNNEGTLSTVEFYKSAVQVDSISWGQYVRYAFKDTTYVVRTTETKTKEVIYDIAVSQLFRLTDEGKYVRTRVEYELAYREADTEGPWRSPQIAEGEDVAYGVDTVRRVTIDGYYTSARLFSYRFLTDEGQYDLRWRRVTADADESTTLFNGTSISVLRSIANHPGISTANLPSLCVIDLRIKASGQLTGVIDQFNCIASAYLPVWSGTEVSYELSDNPAWAYFNILYGYANKSRITDLARYDLDTLLEWAALCDEQGWKCNGIIDATSTVSLMLGTVASLGRASLSFVNNKYSVALDWEKDLVVQVFTPRNSWGFSASKIWPDELHGVRARYVDAEGGYELSEDFVYVDGYDENTATNFIEQQLEFATDWEQVWTYFRQKIAERILRPEVYTISVDVENIRCTRGDRVRLVHDVMLVGLGFARIKAVTTDGSGNALSASIDSTWYLDAVTPYALNIQRLNGQVYEGGLANPVVASDVTEITFSPSIPSAVAPTGGEIVAFGELGTGVGLDCIVQQITPGADLSAKLTLVDYAPDIQVAADGEIPPYDPKIVHGRDSLNGKPNAPVITSIESNEDVIVRQADGSLVTRTILSIETVPSPIPVLSLTVQYRAKGNDLWDTSGEYAPDTTIVNIDNLQDGEVYDFRVQVKTTYSSSDWGHYNDYTVVGKTTPPPAVDAITYEGNELVWSYSNKPIDHKGYLVRFSTDLDATWDSASPAHEGILRNASLALTQFSGDGLLFLVKAVDLVLLESEEAQTINPSIGSVELENELARIEYDPTFPGTIIGGAVSGGDIVADGLGLFWGDTESANYWLADDELFWPDNNYSEVSYQFSYTVPDEYAGERLVLDTTTVGTTMTYYRELDLSSAYWSGDSDTYWGEDDSLFWTSGLDQPEWRPFPGSLANVKAGEYEFLIVVAPGTLQGVIDEVAIVIDTPTITEQIINQWYPAGLSRIVTTTNFRAITVVKVLALRDSGSAVVARISDLDSPLGPAIRLYNTVPTYTAGFVDLEIGGY